MLEKAPIIVRRRGEEPTNWRGFVAVLCLIEFYTQFVPIGTSFFDELVGEAYRQQGVGYGLAYDGPLLVRALCLCGLARSILRATRSAKYWIGAGVLSTLGAVAAVVWVILSSPSSARLEFRNVLYPSAEYALWDQTAWCLPWFAMLVAGLWHITRLRTGLHSSHRAWVVIAAAWCFAQMPLVATTRHPATLSSTIGVVAVLVPATYAIALGITGALLLLHSKRARTFALVIAAIGAALAWYSWYGWWLLTHTATSAHPWTHHLFQATFVRPVALVGPWLLIAVYAWRLPMAWFPDDHSPYPRRYCGHCGYNLYGLVATRCPECGVEFEIQTDPDSHLSEEFG